MPKRTDLKKIMLIGSGPIVIGQACEFDYSGTQALKALREEGYEVVLVNSNPATIMTDPELADSTYIEPITPEFVARIIAKERPDALLPTLGGQTGLNTSLAVAEAGVLDEYGVELIGASAVAIRKAESREEFRQAMENIGLKVPESAIARSIEDVKRIAEEIPFPIIVRPAFTLGGAGGGVAYNLEDLLKIASNGLDLSMKHEILLELSVLGWKEYELEVMCDQAGNGVIICSIENIDAMGVHTGDSVTVAPAQTLTDAEYQVMRNAALNIMREIGVSTGGSNVQFAVNPVDGEMVIIEMNPRVSRSSALASKATGFPIAKIAAKLAVGFTLDELRNDITRETAAAFEPTIDYCVIKIPRFTFEKFPGAEDSLTTAMKSVGETMAIGRTFKEALNKGMRSLETGLVGFTEKLPEDVCFEPDTVQAQLRKPHSTRLMTLRRAMRCGLSDDDICAATAFDPWFVRQMRELVDFENSLAEFGRNQSLTADNPDLAAMLRQAKELGFSDPHLADLWKKKARDIREMRESMGIKPSYYLVDTCAAEFEAYTPYYYSTYETSTEVETGNKRKAIILGGGPNRIGQGIEFDYCCCHSAFALRDAGVESVMVNSNPETVSTDYDTSTRLYFEPLTYEDVMNIIDVEQPEGVIVQFGGQTPLNLAVPLMRSRVPILGTSPEAIDRAEDRERFKALLDKLDLRQPDNDTAFAVDEALSKADKLGYPVVVRPSYVLGGRAMAIVYSADELREYFRKEVLVAPEHPILLDKFLENAIEVDVDALCDGEDTYVAGIMEHIEEAGIHSGDSACVLPPHTIAPSVQEDIARATKALAEELGVVGLMNIQFALKDGELFVLEVNPRASRTAPFVSKATGVPLPRLATQVMLGQKLKDIDPWSMRKSGHVAVKESVFPFSRFPGVDVLLGPEMRSTGEVMGIDTSFGLAFAKGQIAGGQDLPLSGTVFISVNDRDKENVINVARDFVDMGFKVVATGGTARRLGEAGIPCETVLKVWEGRPNILDMIKNKAVDLMINTASGKKTIQDSKELRQATLLYGVPYTTTVSGARAMVQGIKAMKECEDIGVKSLQEFYG